MNEPQKPIRNNFGSLTTSLQIIVVSLGASFISTFLPWAKILVFSFQGTDGSWGISIAILSALAILLYVLDLPRVQNKALQRNVAIGLTIFSAIIYSYCAIRLASIIDMDGGSELFSGVISIGIGMYVGFISSIIAAVLSIEERWKFLAAANIQIRFATAAGTIGLISLSVARWGVLSLISGLLVLAIAMMNRSLISRKILNVLLVIGLVATTGGIARLVTFDSTSSSDSSGIFGDTSNDPKCDELMKEGADVDEVEAAESCQDKDGDTLFLFTMSETCKSGKKLIYNDSGWGYKGETWTKVGDPPSGRCNSSATEQCTTIFAAGAITQESWTSMDECLDGDNVKWVYTSTMPCFMNEGEYIYNDYGWGFAGKPWTLGSDTPSC
jgi:hypothetical protein